MKSQNNADSIEDQLESIDNTVTQLNEFYGGIAQAHMLGEWTYQGKSVNEPSVKTAYKKLEEAQKAQKTLWNQQDESINTLKEIVRYLDENNGSRQFDIQRIEKLISHLENMPLINLLDDDYVLKGGHETFGIYVKDLFISFRKGKHDLGIFVSEKGKESDDHIYQDWITFPKQDS